MAKICAGLRLDTETLCAGLLHDTVEDTSASLEEVEELFGEPIAQLVDGVTKLTGITFQSRDEHQAENYRKMMVAMATDIRVILIKLADRLHNMRTLDALPKPKQLEKARETLEIYAPLAHRLGIHAIKWELEDLAFARLHPRKYDEIKKLVAQQREERERYVAEAGEFLNGELREVGIEAEISGRAKHFYSIYSKMTKKGREFNEIYDLTAMRVIVGSIKDCYGAIGIIHSLWKPLPGRFKDFIATPRMNLYSALHTTVIGPEGRPLEIQIRTRGDARAGRVRDRRPRDLQGGHAGWQALARSRAREDDLAAAAARRRGRPGPGPVPRGPEGGPVRGGGLRLHPEGRGQEPLGGVNPAGLRLRRAHRRRPSLRRGQGERQDRAAALPAEVRRHRRDPHRQAGARAVARLARRWCGPPARATRSAPSSPASAATTPSGAGRDELQSALRKRGLPMQRIAGSPLLADVIREMGFRKADDFYIALGQGKISSKTVTTKVFQRLKQGEAVAGDTTETPLASVLEGRDERHRRTEDASSFGIEVKGVSDVMIRLAKCCRPVPGDEIVGYVSLGRGITIHREDCKNVAALRKAPERFTDVSWDGDNSTSYRVELQVDAWDRTRLLEDLSRAFSEVGINILEASCTTKHPMVKNRFVVEVGDTEQLRHCINRLRNVESVFDAYRITPGE